jgi:3-isopropylmalate/(R)-2-methylmalate dehydratase small subunit
VSRAPFVRVRSIAAPLRWSDVNTDDIYPAPGSSPLAKLPGGREALADPARIGENAFAAFRYGDDGRRRPEFILNRPPYDRAEILVAGNNFGCGSSREAAVWTLQGIGIRAVIAPSFGDIFYGNCCQNGVLPVRLPAGEVEHLMAEVETAADPVVEVDLEACVVTGPSGTRHPFTIGDYHRHALLNGLDEIGATLQRLELIEAHEQRYLGGRPWLADHA